MGIPAFLTQIILETGQTVQVSGGSLQSVPSSGYYYALSNKTSSGDGRSLLALIGTLLSTSDGTATFTCTLDANFRMKIAHNSGSSKTVTLSAALGEGLGWYVEGAGAGPVVIPTGAGGVTTGSPPLWFWTPNMLVSGTGPELFDPLINFGIPTSAGSAQRSADGTGSYVANGIQYEGELSFSMVQPYYRVFPQGSPFANMDLQSWWRMGPRLGRRFLYWRDRSQLVSTSAPAAGSFRPFNYVEVQPTDELRAMPTMRASQPGNLVFWDVRIPYWLTSRVDAVFS